MIKLETIMKTARLQATLARRREKEQIKIEKSAAVERYYDKWGRITSRFESWTTPEYYKEADENYRKSIDAKLKAEKLKNRRLKLQKLFQQENAKYTEELNVFNRPKSRRVSTDVLAEIKLNLMKTEEKRRQADLEAKLYGRWRGHEDIDKVLMNSRTDNHAMAKLSWLDKQVEIRMRQEDEEKKREERQLKLQESTRKHEEFITNCKKMRETEMKELRSIQECNLNEYKTRESESQDLKSQETTLRHKKEEIVNLIDEIRKNTTQRCSRSVRFHNTRRIKMLLRERSDAIRQDLKHDLTLLDKINNNHCYDDESIKYLRDKFQQQYDLELLRQTQIEAMYESEAKNYLSVQDSLWNEEALKREKQLNCLLEDRIKTLDIKINECMSKQRSLNDIKGKHLNAIENSNTRLNNLIASAGPEESVSLENVENCLQTVDYTVNRELSKKLSDLNVRPSDSINLKLEAPRFGRKKVVW